MPSEASPEGPIAGGGVLAEGTAGPVPTSKGVWAMAD